LSVEQIEYHQQISRSFLLACCAFSGALYALIQNQADSANGARQFKALIESY
jgi:adenylate kinase